jgi:predicted TIM-barrel fold metal-dependent hydrolase
MTTTELTDNVNSKDFMGKIIDLDSHEMIPTSMWDEVFGEESHGLADLIKNRDMGTNNVARDDITRDDAPITVESVWQVKGPEAPSAIDLSRRPEVMDAMGIAKQLVYPTFGLLAMNVFFNKDAHIRWQYDPASFDRVSVCRMAVAAHNRWAARTSRSVDPDRMVVAGILLPESVPQMMRDTEEMLRSGIRALFMAPSVPPAGLSPADRELTPFWTLCEEANLPVTFHIGTEASLIPSQTTWSYNVEEFKPAAQSIEFIVEPMRASIVSFASETFLSAMILGGVFERHPGLRCAVVEVGANWLGPLAERLDMWAREFTKRYAGKHSLLPSQYLARNVRVTPYSFEPVDRYLDRWPELSSVYCFSSDYPHIEGGRNTHVTFANRLKNFDAETRRKFFFENASWLFADR